MIFLPRLHSLGGGGGEPSPPQGIICHPFFLVAGHLRHMISLVCPKIRVAITELLPLKGQRVHFLAKISNTITYVLFILKA